MSWLWTLLLAAASLALVLLFMRRSGARTRGWEAVGAALLLGVAGYGFQANPDQPGAPKQPVQRISGDPQAMVAARKAIEGKPATPGDSWVVVADAFARQGQYADAAGVLQGAIERNPDDGDAWLALANALVGHAEGTLSPAALHAYRHAARAAPAHPGPPFFLGLALAQSGRLVEARQLWADLLVQSPPDAPWRAELAERLALLDRLIAGQAAGQRGTASAP